jgi:hypothetical protein
MVRVSGVPYDVSLPDPPKEIEEEDLIAELERENFMLRARVDRLERELDSIRDDGK